MALKMVDARAVEAILFGVYKALHGVAGASSAAIMRRAAPDILTELEKLGVSLQDVNSIEKLESALADTMVNSGCCDQMEFEMNGDELTCQIRNCTFFGLTSALKEEGIPPFGCPFAALTIAVADRNLNKRARVTKLEPLPGGKPGDTMLVVQLHDK